MEEGGGGVICGGAGVIHGGEVIPHHEASGVGEKTRKVRGSLCGNCGAAMGQPWGGGRSHLGPDVPALGPQLVDLGLSHISTFLRLVQLVLSFAELGQVGVGLFLLGGEV